jgi:hypothetical protein
MTNEDNAADDDSNIIPVTEGDLNEEQRGDIARAMEEYKLACLQSYSVTRRGEAVKKFDFPAPHPLTTEQRDSRLLDWLARLWVKQ